MKLTIQETDGQKLARLKDALANADAVLIGAGAGLSTAAGFTYSGARFEKYFPDFAAQYGFNDMYSGGFYPYKSLEEHWAYWSRYIFINRYMDPPQNVYGRLFELVKHKDYFALTTNVDHCFQKAGFDKARLFYTQGDYGLFQCSGPCHAHTYDNEGTVRKMVLAQGFEITGNVPFDKPREPEAASEPIAELVEAATPKHGVSLELRNGAAPARAVPTELVPRCPKCGKPMTMNLRADDTFVEDDGWHEAARRYTEFLGRLPEFRSPLLLELGVGYNTPGIIKYPFWQLAALHPNATYACINKGEAVCPKEIAPQSICLDADIAQTLAAL